MHGQDTKSQMLSLFSNSFLIGGSILQIARARGVCRICLVSHAHARHIKAIGGEVVTELKHDQVSQQWQPEQYQAIVRDTYVCILTKHSISTKWSDEQKGDDRAQYRKATCNEEGARVSTIRRCTAKRLSQLLVSITASYHRTKR
jgi:hypothetical protein